jgi:hypothetical protein
MVNEEVRKVEKETIMVCLRCSLTMFPNKLKETTRILSYDVQSPKTEI